MNLNARIATGTIRIQDESPGARAQLKSRIRTITAQGTRDPLYQAPAASQKWYPDLN